jgi:hypothetical protein
MMRKFNILKLIQINVMLLSFGKVKKVPVFNMFDVWKSFTGQKIYDYDLCLIENNEHMFETTNISLCYGYNLPRANA